MTPTIFHITFDMRNTEPIAIYTQTTPDAPRIQHTQSLSDKLQLRIQKAIQFAESIIPIDIFCTHQKCEIELMYDNHEFIALDVI